MTLSKITKIFYRDADPGYFVLLECRILIRLMQNGSQNKSLVRIEFLIKVLKRLGYNNMLMGAHIK